MRSRSAKYFYGIFVFVIFIVNPLGCSTQDASKDGVGKRDAQKQVGDFGQVVMTVGDKDVPLSEFMYTLQSNYKHLTGAEDPESVMQGVFDSLTEKYLGYLVGVQRGLLDDRAMSEYLKMIPKQWIGYRLESIGHPELSPQIDGEDVKSHYPGVWEVLSIRQITANTYEDARRVRGRLMSGEDFSDLAREVSIDPARVNGGLLGNPIVRGVSSHYTGEELEKITSYKQGEITNPIQTGMGWVLFRIEDRQPLEPEKIQYLKEKIYLQVKGDLENEWRKEVLRKHELKVDESVLEELVSKGRDGVDYSQTAATLGTLPITLGEMISFSVWQESSPATVKDWKDQLDNMKKNLSFNIEGVAVGFDRQQDVVEAIQSLMVKSVRERMVADLRVESSNIPEKELWDNYQQEALVLTGPDGAGWYRLGQLEYPDTESALKAIKKLEGSLPWESLVEEMHSNGSDSGVVDTGMGMATVLVTDMKWDIYTVIKDLPVGSWSEAVQEKGKGVSIYYVEDRFPGPMKPFVEVKDGMRSEMTEERFQKDYRAAILAMRKDIVVTVVSREETLKAVGDHIEKSGNNLGSAPPGMSPHGGGSPSYH
jgi:hypothetical protein